MTIRYSRTDVAVIPAPVEVVWRLLIDELSGAGRWWNTHHKFSAKHAVDAIGARNQVLVRPAGIEAGGPTITFEGRTVEVESDQYLRQAYSGDFRGYGEFRVDGGDEGTRLSFAFDAEPAGWVRLLANVKDVGAAHSETCINAFRRLRRLVDGPVRADTLSQQITTSDGSELAVYTSGPSDGHPVLLLHGWGSASSIWQPLERSVPGSRLIMIDLPGHGGSKTSGAPISVDRLAIDVAEVLAELGIQRVFVVGHSGGGVVGLDLARRAPELIGGLLLLSTAARDAGASSAEVALMGSPLLTAALRRPGLSERVLAHTMGPNRPVPSRRAVADTLAATDPLVRASYFKATQGVDLLDACRLLARVPVIAMRGTQDRVVSEEAAEETAQALGTMVRPVRAGGHALPQERPELVASSLSELIAVGLGRDATRRTDSTWRRVTDAWRTEPTSSLMERESAPSGERREQLQREVNEMTIMVIGGTGKTGRRVSERLANRGVPHRIGSRQASPAFDWNEPEGWPAALDGVNSVYVTYYPDLAFPGADDSIRAFVEEAKAAGVNKLVLLSGRGEPAAEVCEQIVQGSGVNWTIVRCNWFNQNFNESFFLPAVQSGKIDIPAGAAVEPFVDADDIADVAVAALTEPGHDGEVYVLSGPRLLSFDDVAQELSSATGRTIEYTPVSREQYAVALAEQGLPADFAELFELILDGRNASVTDGVQRALGREPKDFAQFAREAAVTGIWTPVGAV